MLSTLGRLDRKNSLIFASLFFSNRLNSVEKTIGRNLVSDIEDSNTSIVIAIHSAFLCRSDKSGQSYNLAESSLLSISSRSDDKASPLRAVQFQRASHPRPLVFFILFTCSLILCRVSDGYSWVHCGRCMKLEQFVGFATIKEVVKVFLPSLSYLTIVG